MPNYKIYYFNMYGRAELARLILAYASVEFEDIRYSPAEWPQRKAKFPFKQLPVLEVDGKMLAQSRAISRYLARKHGLAGKDEWEQALADMYVDCIDDLIYGMRGAYMEKDPEKQKEMMKKCMEEKVHPHALIVEKQLIKNGTGFLVGSEITWADLAYYGFFSLLKERCAGALKDTPHLQSFIESIGNMPTIKKWVSTRPKTDL
nr:GSTsigma1c protein [Diaphanosoma celebensis]